MFTAIRRRLAIRSYAKRLGPELRRRYGRARRYSPAQVKRTVEDCGLNIQYICYALCMYCGRQDFDQYHQARGELCDYNAMWQEIGSSALGSAGNAYSLPDTDGQGGSSYHHDASDSGHHSGDSD